MKKTWLKSYSPGVPEEVELINIPLHEVLTKSAAQYGDRPAFNFHGKVLSYREFDDLVKKFALGIKSLGLGPQMRLGILLPNLVQTAVAIYSGLRVGAISVPMNPLYTDRELEHQFNDSGCEMLICLDTLVPRMLELRAKTSIKSIVSCHIRDYLPFPLKQLFPFVKKSLHLKTPKVKGVYEFSDLLRNDLPEAGNYPAQMEDTALLIYTGGTTGISKGVELTHKNLTGNCRQMSAWSPELLDGGETVLGCLPFFHSYGLTAVLNMSIMHGWCNVLIPKPEVKPILEAVHKYGVSLLPAVPTLFNGLINYPDIKKYNFSKLKTCFSAGAPLPLETIRGFKSLTGLLISEAYGLTESSPCTHAIPLSGGERPGCIGLPLPGTDAKLVDINDDSIEIEDFGIPGELCVKGPQVMKGYFNQPEESERVLKNGWLHTGDIAVMDSDGYFTIVDRKKDMIISGGFNIYPREVDEVLFSHPKIQEACTIGVPDLHSGERIKAYVVLKPGETSTPIEIIDFCRENLTRYKVPKYVQFVDELPKSAVGKILRKELKKLDSAVSA